MCLYILTQSLNKYWLQLLKSIDCIRLCNHKYATFSFNPVIRHSMTHTNRKIWQIKMLNIILSIKRTQVHCTQILSNLFTCLHVMINTDVKQNEMQTWCQQRNKSSKRWPLNCDSPITASKWTSCNAEWQNKISSLCLNTVAGYSEEAPSIL